MITEMDTKTSVVQLSVRFTDENTGSVAIRL